MHIVNDIITKVSTFPQIQSFNINYSSFILKLLKKIRFQNVQKISSPFLTVQSTKYNNWPTYQSSSSWNALVPSPDVFTSTTSYTWNCCTNYRRLDITLILPGSQCGCSGNTMSLDHEYLLSGWAKQAWLIFFICQDDGLWRARNARKHPQICSFCSEYFPKHSSSCLKT